MPGAAVKGMTSPVLRIAADQVPTGKPAGLANLTWLTCPAVRPALLVPKDNWSAPPPFTEPVQFVMVKAVADQLTPVLAANFSTLAPPPRSITELAVSPSVPRCSLKPPVRNVPPPRTISIDR